MFESCFMLSPITLVSSTRVCKLLYLLLISGHPFVPLVQSDLVPSNSNLYTVTKKLFSDVLNVLRCFWELVFAVWMPLISFPSTQHLRCAEQRGRDNNSLNTRAVIVEASHKNSPAKVGSTRELNWWNWSVTPNHVTLNNDNLQLKL